MSGTISNVRSALVKAFTDAALFSAVNTCFENMAFTPGASPWCAVHFVPSQPVIATLGSGGQDRLDGFIQFDLNYPLNTGENAINTKADAIRNLFTVGSRFAYSGQEVVIANCGRSQGRVLEGYFKVYVSVYFYAHITR